MVKPVKSAPPAGLVFAATPMGNAGDASARLVQAMGQADVIAAEDTRKFRQLASRLGVEIHGKVISHFEANEASRVDYILEAVNNGQIVLVVTDAGMPNISDPGYRLVVSAIDAKIPVTVLPGPSAVLTALVLSGLPADRFCFEGFLPRKSGERLSSLQALSMETRTMVFFEAPHRIGKSLLDMVTVFGADRPAAICREMTKTYEEIIRAPLGELAKWAEGDVRGEITLVVAGISAEQLRSDAGLSDMPAMLDRVQTLVSAGSSLKDASAQVAQTAGISRRDVYQAAIAAKAAQGK
jgi:16S rRNA (cytidine1402-2'-O)-methyltransferase